MADFTATFEAGVNGNAITAGAGEASATAWSTLFNGDCNYDNAHTAHGVLACKVTVQAQLAWDLSSVTEQFGRFYIYPTANQASNIQCQRMTAIGGNIALNTNGTIRIESGTGQQLNTTAVTVNNQWNRVEWHVIHSTTVGQFELKLFNDANSVTPTETLTSPATWDTGASCNQITFGAVTGASSPAYWLDDIVANATSYPGPVAEPVPTFIPIQPSLRW